jgi:hypothetical protein
MGYEERTNLILLGFRLLKKDEMRVLRIPARGTE